MLTFKCLNGEGPRYLADLLAWNNTGRSLRSSSERLLQIPKTKLKCAGNRSFKFAAPTILNSLPSELRQSDTVISFKRNLKTHLFKLAYEI